MSVSRSLAVRIERKGRQPQASVAEKFPYLCLNCIEAMPEQEIILSANGNGYKLGALEWLRQTASPQAVNTIYVFNLVDFLIEANRRLS